MCEDVEDVAEFRINDWQSVNLVVNQSVNGIIEAGVGTDPDQVLGVVQLTSPRLQFVLFDDFHLEVRRFVVHLQDSNEVGDGEHANKLLAG